MFCLEVSPLGSATPDQCLAVEMELEQVFEGTWDETDEVDGRIRYRQYYTTENEAKSMAIRLNRQKIKAEIQVTLNPRNAALDVVSV